MQNMLWTYGAEVSKQTLNSTVWQSLLQRLRSYLCRAEYNQVNVVTNRHKRPMSVRKQNYEP
eukprot:m.61157 g.61157  ORF g.61157 m.61157 type:complete len:62 (+) comp13324_c0_seq3:1153-1338(+)